MHAQQMSSAPSGQDEAMRGDPRYMNVTTFRRDGREVTTPVWPIRLDGRLFFGTDTTTGKYKRLKDGGPVRYAVCNGSGKRVLGPWHNGRARRLLDNELELKTRILARLKRKYGWQYWLIMTLYWFQRRVNKGVVYEILDV